MSPSGYYAWRTRPESPRKAANRRLLDDIRRLHDAHRHRHGVPRIHAALRADGYPASRGFFERLMRRHGLRALRDHMRTALPLAALTMAIQPQRPQPGLPHHSDRGRQYAAEDYRKTLMKNGIAQSMSRRGNCWNNPPMESFFGSLKAELVHGAR